MLKIYWTCALGLIFSIGINAQDDDILKWPIYQFDNYQINYPSSWILDTSGQMNTSFILLSPLSGDADDFRENVNLLIQDIGAYNLDLEGFTSISIEQIKAMFSEDAITLNERIEGDGAPFHKLVYSGKQGNGALKFMQYYWVIGEKAYVLTMTSTLEEFEEFLKDGQKILDSFKLN